METKICKKCGNEFPVENFRMTHHGRVGVCNGCEAAKREETRKRHLEEKELEIDRLINEAKSTTLSLFTPRELMEELARRGYEGKLKYTRVEIIDISNF